MSDSSSSRTKGPDAASGQRSLTLAISASILTPLLVIALVVIGERSVRLAPPEEQWVPVVAAGKTDVVPIDVALTWQLGPPVVAPDWFGIVTKVSVKAGDTLNHGDTVVEINGVRRLAISTPMPFFRTLKMGSQGEDVKYLNSTLRGLGWRAPKGSKFTDQTLKAVRKLAKNLGVQGSVTAFEPEWFLYLPASSMTVGSTGLHVGSPAPAAGTVLIPGTLSLTSASVVRAGIIPRTTSDTSGPSTVEGATRQWDFPDSVLFPLSRGDRLKVAGTQVPTESTTPVLGDDSLMVLQRLVGTAGQASLPGIVERPAATERWYVPTAAIVTGIGGQACVRYKEADDILQVRVDVVGSEFGRSIISGSISDRGRVLLGPAIGEWPCV